jgi:hypothetical protein
MSIERTYRNRPFKFVNADNEGDIVPFKLWRFKFKIVTFNITYILVTPSTSSSAIGLGNGMLRAAHGRLAFLCLYQGNLDAERLGYLL